MDPPKPKFCRGDLIRISPQYPYGEFGIIVNVELHEGPNPGGWYAFLYRVLTSCENIIEISESCLSKL